MLNVISIPDDLATCQERLRELLTAPVASASSEIPRIEFETLQREHAKLQDDFSTLEQENEDLKLTVKRLLHQLYGRRHERMDSPGQLHFSFMVGDPLDEETLSALDQLEQAEDEFVEEYIRRRKKRKNRPRCEELPAHLERRTERVEPTLPADCPFQLGDCQLLGIDVVENLDCEPLKLFVHRIEYPKYKLPEDIQVVPCDLPAEVATPVVAEPVVAEPVVAEPVVAEPVVAESVVAEPVVVEPVVVEDVATGSLVASTVAILPAVSAASETTSAATTGSTTNSPSANSPSANSPSANSGQATSQLETRPPEPPPPTLRPPDPPPPETHAPQPLPLPNAPKRIVCLPSIMLQGGGILQAPRLPNVIEGGRFEFGLVTEVVYHKFVLHVPLYRQQDLFAQHGWSPHRSTLCQIVNHAADRLRPLAEFMKSRLLASDVLGTDDTTVTLLTPRVGDGSRTARFWLYRGREAVPYNVFDFTDSREREGPDTFLSSFTGTFTGDCYGGYVNIEQVTGGRIRFAGCWSHARRKVFEAWEQQPELASQILSIIGQLYDLEDRARELTDEARRELRQRESTVWMSRLKTVLDSEAATNVLPKSKFGQALAYLRNHWSSLQLYLGDGRLPIDNNDTERDLRRVAIGRKNWLFLGSEESGERTAVILTVLSSAHRHDLDEWSYVRDVLEQLSRSALDPTHPLDLSALLPDVWKLSHPQHVRTFRSEEKSQRAERDRYRRIVRRREAKVTETSSAATAAAPPENSQSA